MSESCESENCCQHEHAAAANGVENPAVLDAMGMDSATGEVVLVMFEPRPWEGGDINSRTNQATSGDQWNKRFKGRGMEAKE